MDTPKTRRREGRHDQPRKSDSRKIIGRLTYNPLKHKQKFTRGLREKLQKKPINQETNIIPSTKIKFGSFNVNGGLQILWLFLALLGKRKLLSHSAQTSGYSDAKSGFFLSISITSFSMALIKSSIFLRVILLGGFPSIS